MATTTKNAAEQLDTIRKRMREATRDLAGTHNHFERDAIKRYRDHLSEMYNAIYKTI